MRHELMVEIENQEKVAIAEWGWSDKTPQHIISGIAEEFGEVARAINKDEGKTRIKEEIVDVMVVLSRLYSKIDEDGWMHG